MKTNKSVSIAMSALLSLAIASSVSFATTATATEAIDCEKNNCRDLAEQYLETDDIKNAARAYIKGCELNDSASCYNIATIYAYGEIDEPDFLKAVPFYKKGCELLDSDACTDLADEYDEIEDYANALVYYDVACKLNDGYGCRLQAWALDNHITPQNLERSTALYVKGCKLEDGQSCNNLGYDYMGYDDKPNPYATKNYAKGIELMTLACDTYEIGSACTSLSNAYEKGHGVKKDLAESLRYGIKACEGVEDNDSGGCARASDVYEEGGVVKKDLEKARYYLEKGCELSDSISCWNAGVYYDQGKGRRTKNSSQKAQYFYKLACEFGDEDGCEEVSD